MRMYDIIEKKRDGQGLTKAEIEFFIQGYTKAEIPDYQASALLMAIYFQGMTIEESADLTMAMVTSGDVIDLSEIAGVKVDKHSTGGVGDTTTIILAPLVASVGVPVPKMSGRGLGHTGGTLDKLEAFEGFHVEIDTEAFVQLVNKDKLAIIGQSGNLTPADKLLYSLRDVTATVNSIPLIASSIMSKKIAAGADAIVLDVKTGAGAFMKTEADARLLAETMVEIGKAVNKKTMAIISSMEQPLGQAIGNALEIKEAIATLNGEGPADLLELSLTLASEMVVLAGGTKSVEEAREQLEENIENGKALAMFKRLIENQAGNACAVDDPTLLPKARKVIEVRAISSGYVSELKADALGRAAMLLGAGRETKDSVIDLAVGLQLHKKVGDKVNVGDVLVRIHANDAGVEQVMQIVKDSIIIDEMASRPILIKEVIRS